VLKNTAVWVLISTWGGLAITWLLHYLWQTQVRGVDSATSAVVLHRVGLSLVLNTERLDFFFVFVALSLLQAVVAYRLFSA